MAKKKEKAADINIADIMAGVSKTVGAEGMTIAGIPIPSLAFQWLLDSTVFPLSRIVQLTGNPGSCKSTFMYELMQWFINANGVAYLAETEAKPNGLLEAVFDWNSQKIARITQKSETVYEEWVAHINKAMEYYNDTVFDKYGMIFPCAFCVDSIVAAAAASTLEEVSKEGFSKANYPELAKLISKNFQSMPAALTGKPFSFLFVNHQKKNMGAVGFGKEYNEMGGAALRYYSMIVFVLAKIKDNTLADRFVRTIRIKVDKNNGGPEKRTIDVPVVYKREADPTEEGAYIQRVYFDWNTADIQFLINIQASGSGFYAPQKKRLREICDLNPSKTKSDGLVWSDALGISEDSPVTYEEAGGILHGNDDIISALQKELCTHRSIGYCGGVDYNDFLDETRKLEQQKKEAISEAIYGEIAKSILTEGDK